MVHGEIFENIDAVVEHLVNQGWTLSKTYFGNAPYEAIDYGNNRLIYYPQPLHSPLFRGQNEFYDKCTASFYRNNPNRIDEFIQSLKIEEFRVLAEKHPAIKEEIEHGLFFDHIALAQHYEIKTKLLDLTNSLPVAAFFAVTKKENNKYYPLGKSDKPGVLYFVLPLSDMFFSTEKNGIEIYPVGWQIFRRPGEQRAFGIKLENNQNFNELPGIFAFKFWQDESISKKIFNALHGGELLFPPDIFSDKAQKIQEINTYSQASFNKVYPDFDAYFSKEFILEELDKRGIKIQLESVIGFNFNEMLEIENLHKTGKLTENLNARFRIGRDSPFKD